jgi:glycosyltransferase involved in cell wall biosynthesis
MKTLISVIIPIYNTKPYLKEAIDSILQQKDFVHEIIIINDGSTDGSRELLNSLYSHDNFIKILHTENQRQGPARNLGTRIASGDFIYYFDSDDVARPGLFKKFNDLILEESQLELFGFSGEPFLDINYTIDEETKKSLLSTKPYYRKINALCNSGEEAYNLLYDNKSFSPLPYLYIFKKSVLAKNNIEFRSIRFEDEEFTQQLFLFAGKTYISNDVYCERRMREGSTMQLNRCFADILGYMKTIETLEKLLSMNSLKYKTKQNLKNKILDLVRTIIIVKASSDMKLSKEEKCIYKNSLKPFIRSDRNLLIFYYTYSLEYKLRMLKKNGLINFLDKNFISIHLIRK